MQRTHPFGRRNSRLIVLLTLLGVSSLNATNPGFFPFYPYPPTPSVPSTDYSKFVFTDIDLNISCIDTNGNASMFAVTVSTAADGTIFSGNGENRRYDIGSASFEPFPTDGTTVTVSGRFGSSIYDRSVTNTYVAWLRNPVTRRGVSVAMTNVQSFHTATFSFDISEAGSPYPPMGPAKVKGYVTRSHYSYGTAYFNRLGRLVRGATTDGPYYSYEGGITYNGMVGTLKD